MPATPPPTQAHNAAKRSASGTPLMGGNRIASLFKPELVSIFIGRDMREYQGPRRLLCAMSEYFEKSFGERFAEVQLGNNELPEVQHWIFECFIGWLYTQKVVWEHKPATSQGDTALPAGMQDPEDQPTVEREVAAADADHTADVMHPTTWKWEYLFELYVFADKYDTGRIRTAVMELVQTKALQTKPVKYYYPCLDDLVMAFGNLPGSSPLYSLLSDIVTYDV